MPADDRDPKFERALAHHLRAGSAAAGCPDAETLAAYHERSLSLEEMAHWKQHISTCAACQETLALVETTEKQLAEEWQGEDVPVLLETTELSMAAGRSVAAQREEGRTEAFSAPAAAAVMKMPAKRPPLLRWAIPLGTVAAGVLVWIGIHEQSALQAPQHSTVQMAKNQPAPVPEQKMEEALRNTAPPVAKLEQQQAASDSFGAHRDEKASKVPASRVSPSAQAATPGPAAKDAEAAKKEAASQIADDLAHKRAAAPPAANAPAQPKPPTVAAETVEVTDAAPAVPAAGPVSTDNAAAGMASGGREADSKVAGAPQKQKTLAPQQPTNNPNTDALMRKQGVSNELLQAGVIGSGFILSPDNKVRWRLGTAGTVALTTDGGAHWKTLDTGAGTTLTAGSAPSSRVCWLVGKAGTLLLTTDRGAHWSKISSPIAGDLGGVHAADEKRASIWAASNRVSFETADGGATWKPTANE